MNLIDKVIAAISPDLALKRKVARHKVELINSGYDNYGASHTKNAFRGWSSFGGSADEDIHNNLSTLRQRSRDLYCGVPLATAAIKTMRTNVVGQGLCLKSQIDYKYLGIDKEKAREVEEQIEREFSLFADSQNCDAARLDNFYELQQLAFLNWLMSGDVVALLPMKQRVGSVYELCVQLIEADRICTPDDKSNDENIHDGVETDNFGEIVAYYIAKNHPFAIDCKKVQEWKRVEAFGRKTGRRNVLLVSNRERIGQIRGVPFLAPIIEGLKQLGRYTEAELMAAVISGMFTVFIEKEGVSDENPLGELDFNDNSGNNSGPASDIKLAPGTIIDLQEGEKAHDINPGRPNANFGGFVQSICEQIGAALEIPYEVLMKHFSSSYSASRGALLEAWKSFNMYRHWLARDFCQPIFEAWLSEAVAKGRIQAPGFFTDPLVHKAYCGAKWCGPTQGQLDPVKEANAAVIRMENGLSTHATEAHELTGSNFFANIRQLRDENKLIKEAFTDE